MVGGGVVVVVVVGVVVVGGGGGVFCSDAGGNGSNGSGNDSSLWCVGVRSGVVAWMGACLCGAGQPPLLRRGDEATTPSEKAAVRGSNIVVRTSEEVLRLPGVGEGIRKGGCDKAQW